MKRFFYSAALLLAVLSANAQKTNEVKVAIDLKNVTDDKVMVTVTPPAITEATTTYYIPKIVPGTYSEDNYGKMVENLKAYDKKGKELVVARADDNSWKIQDAKKLAKVTYLVNDTYDSEGNGGDDKIFSPAGTNILANENFVLNMHGFVGYFDGQGEVPYTLTVSHPATLWGATSLIDTDKADDNDVFVSPRYADVVDHPIMYSKPDYTTFTVDGMEILLSVYSPHGQITAKGITPEMEKMMRAQKKFLGSFNTTKKYSVLLYMSDMEKPDARGFGALEHNTSTTVVMPEAMPMEELIPMLKDVVSHEFFHIVTPLNIHSKEIQYFNFNTPKMSEHLWMYEGITEYFAQMFQVNQGLISEDEFFERIAGKIAQAKSFDDTMPFTTMSRNVLQEPYKSSYNNVYEKGALIAMCLDIQLRESSNGQRGILQLMKDLAKEYGAGKPFNDEDLFARVTALGGPEIGKFLATFVAGNTPIPYDQYFAKVGVTKTMIKKSGSAFLKNQQEPYITVNPNTKEIIVLPVAEQENIFYKTLGMKGGDVIMSVNGAAYNLDNIYDLIMGSMGWKDGDAITVKIKRGGAEQTLTGKVSLPVEEVEGYHATDALKATLRNAWLKG